ncbi:uncharacterized protein PADG_12388 [Paracoccidioides brasiliensis Pb18]|uniref:Uncharacterized protein n=1 Tax=Paracoccidioides brasiliensis (strain Pb18) TaxID=502780 RepID=A0A0A0HVR2_PARBD|nr:uncharacterized protein PADG_12388 [Paracoccidioides brasiliensis Pb18]KGM91530.1 hypothetical protein PADG_12388 [Paracoccidioides brasiliensis Pb18]ODH48305.1 hypothetical protein GX48_05613 [Paracoccidioides brasiliensis]
MASAFDLKMLGACGFDLDLVWFNVRVREDVNNRYGAARSVNPQQLNGRYTQATEATNKMMCCVEHWNTTLTTGLKRGSIGFVFCGA